MKLFLISSLFLVLTSFHKQDGVLIIFENDTPKDFKSLTVNILGKDYYFQNIPKGQRSDSIRVAKTYKYCLAKAVTDDGTLSFVPFDYVGETVYKQGKFLMKLTNPVSNYLNIECESLK